MDKNNGKKILMYEHLLTAMVHVNAQSKLKQFDAVELLGNIEKISNKILKANRQVQKLKL